MNVLIETYYILLPIVATALIGWVGKLLKEQKRISAERDRMIDEKEKEALRVRKANSTGIMLVLRYMLRRYHNEYKIMGKITYNQYKEWIDLYSAYKALGGNSIAVEWNEDVEKLEKTDYASEMSAYEALLRDSLNKQNK